MNEENKAGVALAIADGKAAITYVRQHAAEYKIAPDRIGITGGSSGGTIVGSYCLQSHSGEQT